MLGGAVTGRPCPSTSPSSMKPSGPCCPSSGSTSESFGSLIFFIEPFLPVADGLICQRHDTSLRGRYENMPTDRVAVGYETPYEAGSPVYDRGNASTLGLGVRRSRSAS